MLGLCPATQLALGLMAVIAEVAAKEAMVEDMAGVTAVATTRP